MATQTPLSDAALNQWPEFERELGSCIGDDRVRHFLPEVRRRLEAGRREYGDSSFLRPLSEIREEMRQECLDIVGWMVPAWWRVDEKERAHLKDRAREAFLIWSALQGG